jgi:D-alanyl-D-alanine carboxypeptidase
MTPRRLALALLAVAVAALLSTPAAASARLSASTIAAIDVAAATSQESGKVPGLAVSVVVPGKGSYVKAYGVVDTGSNDDFDTGDHVRIGGITKSFTATAILALVDRGRLSLDDRLSKWVNGVPGGKRVTVRQLLAMRSGLYDYTKDPEFAAAFEKNPGLPFKPRDILPILKRHAPLFAPDERTEVSDTNYVLMGIVLEKLTGLSAEAAVKRLVIDPSRLRDTSFPLTATLPSPLANGYFSPATGENADALFNYTSVNPKVAWTAGGMVSTLSDLRRWGRALAKGTLLSKRLQAKRLHFGRIPNPGGPVFGYGLGIFRIGDWIGHNGAILGFNAITMYERRTGAQVAVVANKSSNVSAEATAVFLTVAAAVVKGSVDPAAR